MTGETLRGTIERITYHNEENGYTVALLQPESQALPVTVVGNMLGINIGECVALTGVWQAHPQYGRQFKADAVKTVLPATVAGIEKYLGSGLIKGVGPVTAKRIVGQFGAETLQVIEDEPERLLTVAGVGRKRVDLIARAWAEQQKIKEVMLFLQSHNVSTGLAVRIYKQYGDDAVQVVQSDPYRLAREVFGIGFVTADKIARDTGISHDAPERVAAGVAYVLSQAADEGHVYLPAAELTRQAAELLGVTEPQAAQGIQALREADQVMVEEGAPARESDDVRPPHSPGGERPVYLLPFYYGEVGVAGRLRRLAEAPADKLAGFQSLDWEHTFITQAHALDARQALTPKQQEAVRAALTRRISVLTGGPGTGKTTTVRSILRLAQAGGAKVALCSPTGRAAKRLGEATGQPAQTIHRLLEFKPAEGMTFQRNEDDPLEAALVIVDEASMLDLLLTNHLLKAIPPGAHLLLVGDIDQLPSVGAGNVLRDIIAAIEGQGTRGAPGPLPNAAVVRLDTIFRQAEGSYIIANAHRINRGLMPVLDNRGSVDFFIFREEEPEKVANLIVELVSERIPRKFGLSHSQIQVLSPMHRGEAGVGALNARLQAALNPGRPGAGERLVGGKVFRTGDRVMQIRNNYDKDVFNGDMGQVTGVDLEEQEVRVRMEDREITYDFLELDELVHSYAVSVHKAQGSEFPAVVVPVMTTHYMMLQRNLLYTAITRAQRLVVLVGTERAVRIAVHNIKAHDRYSGLSRRLTGNAG